MACAVPLLKPSRQATASLGIDRETRADPCHAPAQVMEPYPRTLQKVPLVSRHCATGASLWDQRGDLP